MTIQLPKLPYANDALAPLMSSQTLDCHYGKHHRGYVDKLNKAIEGSPYAELSLREIVLTSYRNKDIAVFNNAAQSVNHEIFWKSLSPQGGGTPTGALRDAIDDQFGSVAVLVDEFRTAAITAFGSGWIWLAADGDRLRILSTSNAGTPITDGLRPLLTLDVWEHAYYLDYQNDRGKYVETFLDKMINWQQAGEQFEALKRAA